MAPPASLTDPATAYCVQAFESLKPRRPEGEAEALEMLKKAAWQVQPLMKRRQWRIAVLRELEPENMSRAGDNYNRGEVVRIKVRRRGGGFESYEHVLKVLLHELCHNEHGAHSASFYKLLDDITQECEELMAKGQGGTGAGFDAEGVKLGHRGGWGVTPGDPRDAAREAALKRAKLSGVMGGGGKLGSGGGSTSGAGRPQLPPREAAAAAAERRAAAQRFSREHGLEDDAVEAPPVSGAGGESAAGAAAQLAAPPRQQPPRGKLAFGRVCVCGACGEAAPPGACAQRAAAPPARAAAAAIELLDDDDDDVIIVDPPPRSSSSNSQQQACWLCSVAAQRCACWTCACTRRNAAAAARCGTCDAWRYARGGPPAP